MFPDKKQGPIGVGMSMAGRAAVMDLGLGSDLAQEAAETEEQKKQRLAKLMNTGSVSSTLGLNMGSFLG